MTERLYWADSHLREFDARVLSCTEEKGRWAVVLDQTAFFPEGGGQSADTGTLSGVAVEDTRERGESVVHLCGAPLAVGSAVHGVLDWGLRFQRMQFHSAEHILSGLAHRKWGCNNVGFHMNPAFVTLAFDRELTADHLAELEAELEAAKQNGKTTTEATIEGMNSAIEQATPESKRILGLFVDTWNTELARITLPDVAGGVYDQMNTIDTLINRRPVYAYATAAGGSSAGGGANGVRTVNLNVNGMRVASAMYSDTDEIAGRMINMG